ncbi:hypothetical protein BGZ94_008827, partial [Podila epigama]
MLDQNMFGQGRYGRPFTPSNVNPHINLQHPELPNPNIPESSLFTESGIPRPPPERFPFALPVIHYRPVSVPKATVQSHVDNPNSSSTSSQKNSTINCINSISISSSSTSSVNGSGSTAGKRSSKPAGDTGTKKTKRSSKHDSSHGHCSDSNRGNSLSDGMKAASKRPSASISDTSTSKRTSSISKNTTNATNAGRDSVNLGSKSSEHTIHIDRSASKHTGKHINSNAAEHATKYARDQSILAPRSPKRVAKKESSPKNPKLNVRRHITNKIRSQTCDEQAVSEDSESAPRPQRTTMTFSDHSDGVPSRPKPIRRHMTNKIFPQTPGEQATSEDFESAPRPQRTSMTYPDHSDGVPSRPEPIRRISMTQSFVHVDEKRDIDMYNGSVANPESGSDGDVDNSHCDPESGLLRRQRFSSRSSTLTNAAEASEEDLTDDCSDAEPVSPIDEDENSAIPPSWRQVDSHQRGFPFEQQHEHQQHYKRQQDRKHQVHHRSMQLHHHHHHHELSEDWSPPQHDPSFGASSPRGFTLTDAMEESSPPASPLLRTVYTRVPMTAIESTSRRLSSHSPSRPSSYSRPPSSSSRPLSPPRHSSLSRPSSSPRPSSSHVSPQNSFSYPSSSRSQSHSESPYPSPSSSASTSPSTPSIDAPPTHRRRATSILLSDTTPLDPVCHDAWKPSSPMSNHCLSDDEAPPLESTLLPLEFQRPRSRALSTTASVFTSVDATDNGFHHDTAMEYTDGDLDQCSTVARQEVPVEDTALSDRESRSTDDNLIRGRVCHRVNNTNYNGVSMQDKNMLRGSEESYMLDNNNQSCIGDGYRNMTNEKNPTQLDRHTSEHSSKYDRKSDIDHSSKFYNEYDSMYANEYDNGYNNEFDNAYANKYNSERDKGHDNEYDNEYNSKHSSKYSSEYDIEHSSHYSRKYNDGCKYERNSKHYDTYIDERSTRYDNERSTSKYNNEHSAKYDSTPSSNYNSTYSVKQNSNHAENTSDQVKTHRQSEVKNKCNDRDDCDLTLDKQGRRQSRMPLGLDQDQDGSKFKDFGDSHSFQNLGLMPTERQVREWLRRSRIDKFPQDYRLVQDGTTGRCQLFGHEQ